jgi:hypothetical protein
MSSPQMTSAKPEITFLGTNLKKLCSDGKYERFFKYFPIHTLIFEKMCADDVICSCLGLNGLTRNTSVTIQIATILHFSVGLKKLI